MVEAKHPWEMTRKFSKAFKEYLMGPSNNEAWQCPSCKAYMPFYVDECYFCGQQC